MTAYKSQPRSTQSPVKQPLTGALSERTIEDASTGQEASRPPVNVNVDRACWVAVVRFTDFSSQPCQFAPIPNTPDWGDNRFRVPPGQYIPLCSLKSPSLY